MTSRAKIAKIAKIERRALELLADTEEGLYLDELQAALGELAVEALGRLEVARLVRVYPGLCYYATTFGRSCVATARAS